MKKQTLSRVLQCVSLGCIALAAILQTVAMRTAFAADKNYFADGAWLPVAAAAFAILAGVLGVISSCIHPKETLAPSPAISSALPGIPAFCALTVGAASLLLTAWSMPFTLPTALLLLLSAFYFLFYTEKAEMTHPAIPTVLGFFAVAACAMVNVYCYFDASLEMNAPVKVTVQTALLFTMLALTAELRFPLGRAKPRLYLILSWCAAAALSLPSFSILFGGATERGDYRAFGVVTLGLFATVLLRLLCYLGLIPEDKPTEPALAEDEVNEAIEEFSEEIYESHGETEEAEIPEETAIPEEAEEAPAPDENDDEKETAEE